MPPKKSHHKLSSSKGGVFDEGDFPPLPSQNMDKPVKQETISKASSISSPTKATFNDLPTELILHILDYLPALDLRHFNLSTVLSLSSTNKRMHDIVVDRLYNTYNSFFCKPFPFLRTMMANPVAAGMVKSVNISYGTGVHEDRVPYFPSLDDKRIIKTGFKSLELQDWKTWASECNTQGIDQEMLFAAILMHTPNLTTLDVDDGKVSYQAPKWVEIMSTATSSNPPPHVPSYSQLRSICIDIGTLKLRNLTFLFRMPSLRQLKIKGLVETEDSLKAKKSSRWPIQAGSSGIERLFLSDCFMHTSMLVNMINSCRALKHIWYDHRDDRWYYQLGQSRNEPFTVYPEAPGISIDYPTLDVALNLHRHSLKTLQLEHGVEHGIGPGSLKCVSDMETLEYVAIPPRAFLSNHPENSQELLEAFPPSLTALQLLIERDDLLLGSIPEALKHVALRHSEYVPKLRTVIVHSQAPPSELPLGPLSKLYSDNKIHLKIIQKPDDVVLGWEDSDDDFSESSDESDESDESTESL